jgi:Methane oxygenase PmoA
MKFLLSIFAILLALPTRAAEPRTVKVTKTDKVVEFSVGDELVTRYHVGPDVAKPYLWPLNGPGGVPATRGWPLLKGLAKETTDHVHQKSGWFCHGDVIPEGIDLKVHSADKHVKGVDFWSETPGHGTIVCVELGEPKTSDHEVSLATRNEWNTPDGIKILDEGRTVTVRDLSDARIVIFDIDLHASVCPIIFGDTKEGSMGVRVSDEIKAKGGNGKYVNADGNVNEKDVWGRRSDWNDYFGKVGDQAVGIAIFDDPRNKYHACWHSREYGLMAANPFGRAVSGFPDVKGQTELARIPKGEHLKLRYGILLHRGDAKEGKVAERFAAFAKD